MNKVEPIRNPEKIAQIKNLLKAKDDPRDYLLFTLGINFALRIQDLLSLKVKDVLDLEDGKIKEYVYLRERKTGRQKRIRVNRSAREALEHCFSRVGEVDPEDYLFRSRRSGKPLDRSRAYRLVREWTEAVGLTQGRYGTQLEEDLGLPGAEAGCAHRADHGEAGAQLAERDQALHRHNGRRDRGRGEPREPVSPARALVSARRYRCPPSGSGPGYKSLESTDRSTPSLR